MAAKVLVTGGAGYIGSHACKALAASGYTPVAYDNLVHGHRSIVRWGPFVEGDVGDREKLEFALRAHRVDAVMHFAGYAYVGESMSDPGRYFRNNVAGSLTLLDAIHRAGVRHIVFSSTCATYGMPESVPIREDHPQRPVSPYGESKLFFERALHWYEIAHGLQSAVLRYFNAAGADPEGEIGEYHDPETHLIPIAIHAALGDRVCLEIFGTDYSTPDGTAVRDYIHVTDLADAHVRALDRLLRGAASIAVNLGTGRGHSVREVVAAVERVSGRNVPVRVAARRAGDPPQLVADANRARALLDWKPGYSDL
ncbi:MAG: UDP-glucose 4-epimerase GalE, partial [Betaproteobacteria bacterium]|nr:UDP-glucose 4-epimerase GalE [Betaproteobacteria bacterium]